MLSLVSCDKNDEKETSKMRAVLYTGIDDATSAIELLPGRSKTMGLRAYADAENGNVSDQVLNITFKADLDAVDAYNQVKGTDYVMCPGSAYEFITNTVMMPRYGQASTTAKLKITANGLDPDLTYLLPVTIDEVIGTDNWELSGSPVSYLVIRQAYVAPDGGSGTKDSPYNLYNIVDMLEMSEKLEEGNMIYFQLMNDIDMMGIPWVPLNFAQPYKLQIDFNGNNHTISNFYCNAPNYASFFGVLYGRCYDVTFKDAVIEGETSSACGIIGGYCGTSGLPGEARNVHVSGSVTSTGSVNGVGGLFGRINGATIIGCSADCEVYSNKSYCGGLYGYDAAASTVSDCWTAGHVKAAQRVGGITGGLVSPGTKIYNCYSTMEVEAGFAIGGIAGHCNQDQKAGTPLESQPNNVIDKCIAWNGYVHATNNDESVHYSSGAIAGFTSVKNYLSDCYRKADLDFQECATGSFNVLYDQENASPSSPLSIAMSGEYNFPYHGKAAAATVTLSALAKSLGWSEAIWDFSGAVPVHKGGSTVVDDENGDSTGQLPDFDDNEFYK